MIYLMVPFSMIVNDPNPDFKCTLLFSCEYISQKQHKMEHYCH